MRVRQSWLCCVALVATCACATTPAYSVRPTPTPEETSTTLEIERTISEQQSEEFEKQGARQLGAQERVFGFVPQQVVDRLGRTSERAYIPFRVYLYQSKDPNAAALADGRIYISTGMLDYLAQRGSREDELAFVLGHEIGHTAAQHLVQRYRQLEKQQLMMALAGLGVSAVTRGGGERAQQIAGLAKNAAELAAAVSASSYSQQQELEADQLGVRYVIRAGYDPRAGLKMLEDFQRFDVPGGFLRTHPYTELRRQYLERYLQEIGYLPGGAPAGAARLPEANQADWTTPIHEPAAQSHFSVAAHPANRQEREERRKQLLETQKLYPVGSQSWKNLQHQINQLQ